MKLLQILGVLWCRLNHDMPCYVRGLAYYRCAMCGRRYAVPWARPEEVPPGVWYRR